MLLTVHKATGLIPDGRRRGVLSALDEHELADAPEGTHLPLRKLAEKVTEKGGRRDRGREKRGVSEAELCRDELLKLEKQKEVR